MVTLQAFLSLLAGFATMALIMIIVAALLRQYAPGLAASDERLRAGYVLVNLTTAFVAAGAGGYVTAWAAGFTPLPYVLVLAVAVLVLGAISALQARGRQPLWYQMVLLVIAPLGVVAGGLLRLRVVGIL